MSSLLSPAGKQFPNYQVIKAFLYCDWKSDTKISLYRISLSIACNFFQLLSSCTLLNSSHSLPIAYWHQEWSSWFTQVEGMILCLARIYDIVIGSTRGHPFYIFLCQTQKLGTTPCICTSKIQCAGCIYLLSEYSIPSSATLHLWTDPLSPNVMKQVHKIGN